MPLDASTQISIGPYACWDEGTEETFNAATPAENHAVRTLRCAWQDRLGITQWLMGGSSRTGAAATYHPAHAYPDQPNWSCRSVRLKGEGVLTVGAAGLVAYERAVLSVTYGVPQWAVGDPNQLGEQEIDFAAADYLVPPTRASFKWSDGTELPPAAVPSLRVTTIHYSRTRFGVDDFSALLATMESLTDTCNSITFEGAAPETILFRGARSRRTITSAGEQRWAVTFNFARNKLGWNVRWRPGVGWAPFTRMDGTKLYPTADLNQLYP